MEIDAGALSGNTYDLIIVGSGPAGLALARKYDELATGKTLIVESGDRSDFESEAQKLNVLDADGDIPTRSYLRHNQRMFGGTSTVWSGWCAVLEKRPFLNHEWPFAYDDLYKWYPEAAKILGLPEESHTLPEKAFPDNPNIVCKPYYIIPYGSRRISFGDWLARSGTVSVLFNHTVTNVGIRNGAASRIFIRDSSGDRQSPAEVSGRKIVLAAGGIQNARLLQLSLPDNRELPIGRYFCEHPHIPGYASLILDWEKFRNLMVQTSPKSPIVHAIALSSEFSNTHRLISATFEVSRPWRPPRILSKNLLGKSRRVMATNTEVRTEMSPDAGNRVTLSKSRRDHMGQPIAHVALKFDPQETLAAYKHLNAQLIRSGLGRMGPPQRTGSDVGGGHMMGTTRMGSDPTLSVTDAQGRVHGVKNLYVAGSSLFPSTAAANPTFTIVALSLRLADYLAKGT